MLKVLGECFVALRQFSPDLVQILMDQVRQSEYTTSCNWKSIVWVYAVDVNVQLFTMSKLSIYCNLNLKNMLQNTLIVILNKQVRPYLHDWQVLLSL